MHQKEFINNYDFRFKKKLGQNFIIDDNTLNNIVDKACIEKNALIIEIGCGAGALTTKLVKNAKNVLGYEIDTSLKPILNSIESENSNLEVIYDDFLKRNIIEDIEKYSYDKLYVIANLPYYITTPIVTKLIEEKIDIYKVVIMVQKEVGDRFNAKPNSKDYNSLSVFINYNFDVRKLLDISKNVFIPKPNVDSIVIELLKKDNNYKVLDEQLFFKLVRDSFRQKRKTLKNNLKEYNYELVENIIKKHNLPITVRAEQISIEIFIEISNAIKLS